jgi:hypothetical protein
VTRARSPRREPLRHNPANGVTVGIWREWYRGSTCVVKHLGRRADAPDHWSPSEDPRHWNFWRREALVYRHGLPQRLGLEAPELVDLVADDRGGVELKLEDVAGRTGAELTVHDYAAAARALGRSQGRPRPDVDEPWLSRAFLRQYSGSKPFDRALLDVDGLWSSPLASEHLAALRDPLCRLRDERDRLLTLVERCPRAVCHLDAWAMNVIRRPGGEVVFVDWGFVGDGAVGEDPSNLVIDSVMDLLWPPERLAELDETVFHAYLDGLHDAGWRGDERQVRLAMCAAAVKYEWLPVVVLLQAASDAPGSPVHAYGVPADLEELVAARAVGLELVARYADEARRLADVLNC